MAANQEARQASVRAVTGTVYDYNGDWSALFDGDGIAQGDWNGRLLAWINSQLGVTYTDIPSAQTAFAIQNGANSWNELGTFTTTLDGLFVLEADGTSLFTLEAGTFFLAME